jgi:hypothetical protein
MHPTRWRFCLTPLLAASLFLAAGCGGYGEVSPAAYDIATALYSISNGRAADRLAEINTKIEAARASGDLTEQEASWLSAIVSDARNGDWAVAAKESRRILADQVKMP